MLLITFHLFCSGKSDHKTKQPAYRPFYGQLGELRSLAGPSVPLVALTATASKATRELIMKDLCMNEQTFKLVVDPNKENIKYSVVNTNFSRADIANDFDWLVELLKEKGKDAPWMIIFFRKIDHISDVYKHLETVLGPSAYVDYQQEGPNDDRNRLFDMYHLKTDEAVKESVAASYQDPNGITRVVLCSTSFSMGLDVKGVNTIIHYGPSSDLDDYILESGRAGRQPDDNAHAVIMRYKRCLSSKNISKEMKTFIKTKTCRRQVLLEPFIEKFKALQNGHDCCDICALTCSCLCYCDSGSICSCEIRCSYPVSKIVSAMKTTTWEEADGNSSWEDSSSDSDIEAYRARKPIVLTYSDDDDYE